MKLAHLYFIHAKDFTPRYYFNYKSFNADFILGVHYESIGWITEGGFDEHSTYPHLIDPKTIKMINP